LEYDEEHHGEFVPPELIFRDTREYEEKKEVEEEVKHKEIYDQELKEENEEESPDVLDKHVEKKAP
jgi:hypothetical protein